jgi:hypothetical protein
LKLKTKKDVGFETVLSFRVAHELRQEGKRRVAL